MILVREAVYVQCLAAILVRPGCNVELLHRVNAWRDLARLEDYGGVLDLAGRVEGLRVTVDIYPAASVEERGERSDIDLPSCPNAIEQDVRRVGRLDAV